MKYFKTAMITEKFRIIFFLLLMNGCDTSLCK